MHGPEKCSTDGSLETPLSSEQQQRHRSLSRELHQFASLCCCSMRIAHLCWRVDRRACCSCNLLRRRLLVLAAVPLRLSSVERRAKEHLRASTQQPGQGQLHRTMHTDPTDGSAAFAAGSVSRDRARHVPSRLSPSLCAKTYAGLFHVDREGVTLSNGMLLPTYGCQVVMHVGTALSEKNDVWYFVSLLIVRSDILRGAPFFLRGDW